jgi:general secretion pathway protein G
MSSATHSRTAKTLKLLALAALSGAILLLANGDVCTRTILQQRESVLKYDLATMRKAIDLYTVDKKRAPKSMQALVDEEYLREVPVNPVTHKVDWIPHYVTVDRAGVGPTVGIDDVHAASRRTSSEGTPYGEW